MTRLSKRFMCCLLMAGMLIPCLTEIGTMTAQAAVGTGQGAVLFVSEGGDDADEGTIEKPLRSLEAARDRIRELKRTGLPDGGVTVYVRGGEYNYVENSFVLDERDSGEEGKQIVYQAYGEEEVKLTGNITVQGARFQTVTEDSVLERLGEEVRDKVLVYDLKKNNGIEEFAPIQKNGFNWPDAVPALSLTVDGQPQQLSRYPNEGFLPISRKVTQGFYPRMHSPNPDGTCPQCSTDNGGMRIHCNYGTVYDWMEQEGGSWECNAQGLKEKASLWAKEKDIWTFGYFGWAYADDNLGIESIEATDNGLLFQAVHPSFYSILPSGDGNKFYVYNMLCEIDRPGEWYLDRDTGKLYLYPEQNLSGSSIEMSLMSKPLVKMENTEYVQFIGLDFSKSNSHGIQMTDCSHVTVAGCGFYDLGQRGVVCGEIAGSTDYDLINSGARGGSYNVITSCDFKRTGQGAVFLGGGSRYTLTPSNSRVVNCDFEDFSVVKRTYAPAVALAGAGSEVIRNKMYNAPHAAITYEGNDFNISGNEIYNVCYETSDVGAIYACRKWSYYGVKIENNYIHDLVTSHGTGSAAVYIDDMTSGAAVRNNLFVNIPGYTTLFGGGRDIVCENNILLNNNNGRGFHYDARALGWAKAAATAPDGACYAEVMNLRNHEEFDAALWAERYPAHEEMVASFPAGGSGFCSDAAVPAGASVQNNIFVGCSSIESDIADQVKQNGTVVNNKTYEMGYDIGFEDPDVLNFEVKEDSEIRKLMGKDHFDASGVGTYVDEYRTQVGNTLDQPQLLEPADQAGEVNAANGVVLKWNPVDHAGGYRVELAKDELFEQLVFRKTTREFTMTADCEPGSQYYWRVTAVENRINPNQTTSKVRTFTTSQVMDYSILESFGDPSFSEWKAMDGKGTPSQSMEHAKLGKYSYLLDEAADVIYRELPSKRKDIVTLWMYDNMVKGDGLALLANVTPADNWYAMGLHSKYPDYYTLRIGGSWLQTEVLRTEGWHQLKWDYSAENELKMYIDDVLVRSETVEGGFNYIAIGDHWVQNMPGDVSNVLFDDLRIGAPSTEGTVSSVTLDQTEVTLVKGSTLQLIPSAEVTPDVDVEYEWIQGEYEIARVDENGLVTANRAGSAIIKLGVKNHPEVTPAECRINVISEDPPVPEMTLEKARELVLNAVGDMRVSNDTTQEDILAEAQAVLRDGIQAGWKPGTFKKQEATEGVEGFVKGIMLLGREAGPWDQDISTGDAGIISVSTGNAAAAAISSGDVSAGNITSGNAEENFLEISILKTINSLPVTIDRTRLNACYERYKDTVYDRYTETSWKGFQRALQEAERVLNKVDAEQEEIDTAQKTLEDAVQSLEKIPEDTEDGTDDTPDDGGDIGDHTEDGNTEAGGGEGSDGGVDQHGENAGAGSYDYMPENGRKSPATYDNSTSASVNQGSEVPDRANVTAAAAVSEQVSYGSSMWIYVGGILMAAAVILILFVKIINWKRK